MEKKFCTKGIYNSGMVLQRNKTGSIYGTTEVNTKVCLDFRGLNHSCVSDEDGNWKIEFNPGEAGGPFELILESNNQKISFSDVYVGEVWVSSGQSNAQLPMERLYYKYRDEFLLPENPNIRIITVPISYSFDGEKDYVENPTWLSASPDNLKKLSGTAYFFAKKLQEDLKVPVGIINASQGGSPITAWMSYDSLKDMNKKDLLENVNHWNKPGEIENKKKSVLEAQQKWDEEFNKSDVGLNNHYEKIDYCNIEKDWTDCEIPSDLPDLENKAGVVWLKKEITLSAEEAEKLNSKNTHLWMGTIQDADKIWVNGEFCGVTYYAYPPRRYIVPEGAFVEGKNTITIRVQKNGYGPIRFYKEKPYCIFTDDVLVQPSVTRNLEHFKGKSKSSGIKIDLSGKWKKFIACEKNPRPGEMFFEWEPTALYNSMLSPAFNYAISGALWYQGESNAGRYFEYKELLVKMVEVWREKFVYGAKNLPVIVAQLPNWADGHDKDYNFEIEDWAELRQTQKNAVEELDNAGLAVLIDAGEWNDLHPESKMTVGTRAAKEALRIAYNKKYNSYPKVEYCQKDGREFVIRFDCGTAELKSYKVENDVADFSKEDEEVFGFEMLLEDGSIINAKSSLISKTDVKVEMPEKVLRVKELRYLWRNNPWIVNLYSSEGIPAAPFKIRLE